MANLLSTIISGRLSIGSSSTTPYLTEALDGIVFGGNEVGYAYRLYTQKENYGGDYTKLNIAWHTGIKIGAYYGYGGIRFYNNSPASGTEVFSVAKGDSNVRIANTLIFSSSNGTMISNGTMTDAIGWNSSYGTYIGSTVGGTYYIYGNGRFYDNGTIRTLIHSGNIGSQSVSYATTSGTANIATYFGGFTAYGLVEEARGVHSFSDFPNGTLVTTDINASEWAGDSFVMEVSGKSYGSGTPFKLAMEGYLYADTVINVAAMSYGSYFPSPVKVMNLNGNLAFWWPRGSYWNSFEVHVRAAGGESWNRVTGISDSAEPASATKKVSVTPVQVLHTNNFTSYAQEKENQRLSTGNSPTFVDIYANNWFRNNQSNEGLYNEATTMHWSSRENGFWDVSSTNGESSIRFYTGGHINTLRGYVYADASSNIGFLNNAGNWALRMSSARNAEIFGPELTINAANAVYSSINMNDGDEGQRIIHCNSNRIGFLTQAGAWGSWCSDDGSWNSVGSISGSYLYSNNSVRVGEIWSEGGLYRSSGIMLFGTENEGWRFSMANSQKMYIGTDGNIWMAWAGDYISNLLAAKQNASTAINTSNIGSQSVNYASSAGNSATTSQIVFSDLKINFPSGAGGGHSFGSNHYSMGLDSGNGGWDHPHYRDVIIGYHTGVRIGANYSGIRFYDNSPTTDANNDGNGDGGEKLLMTIGGYVGTANHTDVVVNNNLFANVSMRSPIFYDSNDTNYYLDPNSTLKSLNIAGNIDLIARSASWAEGIRVRVPSTSTWGGIRFTRDRGNDDGNWAIGFTGIDSSDDLTIWANNGGDGGAMKLRIHKNGTVSVTNAINAYSFQGNANVAGTGNASYHPSGIYSTGTNWLYGTMYMNDNSIRDVKEVYNNGWFRTVGHQGIYNPTNDAHFYPNNASYGSWRIDGTRNGWHGLHFNSGSTLMMNSAETGVHREGYGWQFRWYNGSMFVSRGTYGGGTEYTVIDSGTIGSQSVNYANSSASSNQSNSLVITGYGNGSMTYYQTPGTFAGYSGWAGYFVSNHGDGATYYNQTIIMPFWGAPQYSRLQGGTFSGPYTFWSTENLNDYAPNMNQYVRTTDNVTFNTTTSPTILVNNHSDNTRGYRIHNTSGSSVSAMFTNSANALVIGAGAFDQVQLNKKTLISGAALGVNVAASATAGRIDASNDIVAYSSSDERLKYNIAPIENALDKVKSLTGVEFDWKPEYNHAHGYEGHDTGIIAQQVQDVMPSAVRTNDTGFLAVRYEKLIGLLIEGMKEQQEQIEELKAQLNGLTK